MNIKIIAVAGGAMFSMLFGSGNIVVPIILAQQINNGLHLAFLGFFLTGILLPITTLLIMFTFEGESERFFKILGTKITNIIQFVTLAIFGPLAVTPRCLSVSLGGFRGLNETVCDTTFYICISIVLFILAINKDKVLNLIGKFLTPLKTFLLSLILILSIANAPEYINVIPIINNTDPILTGALNGYQTLDAFCSIYFSKLVYSYLRANSGSDDGILLKNAIGAGLLCGLMISVVYIGFFAMGGLYHNDIIEINPTLAITKIANIATGSFGSKLVGLTIMVTCVVTAVSLTAVWSSYLQDLIYNVFKIKISYILLLIPSIITTFMIVATIGFNGIYNMLAPILSMLYPLVIICCVFHIISIVYRKIFPVAIKNDYE